MTTGGNAELLNEFLPNRFNRFAALIRRSTNISSAGIFVSPKGQDSAPT
jgi:hypothetical protein